MRKIGFCHGDLFKIHDVNTKENIEILKACGSNAIEINCHHAGEMELINTLIPFIKNFEYISMHTPGNIRYGNNLENREILSKLENLYSSVGAKLVVVHPDLVDNWDVFNDYKINWAIENMDARKESFKDVASLKNFFVNYPSWNLVLDVGHCNDNDKSMLLAKNIIFELRDKIKEIHLSGYLVFHDPLYRTKQTEIIDCCKELDVPIIIESIFEISDGIEGVKKEFDYIVENLK